MLPALHLAKENIALTACTASGTVKPEHICQASDIMLTMQTFDGRLLCLTCLTFTVCMKLTVGATAVHGHIACHPTLTAQHGQLSGCAGGIC